MKRRNFVQSLLVVPATAVAAEQAAQPTVPPQQQPQPSRMPPNPGGAAGAAKITLLQPDSAAETEATFFSPAQFAALTKLAAVLVPPVKKSPGAIDAHAPEFLDFLISRSPQSTQTLYRDGLDGLNASAKNRFHKPFADLAAEEADSIIRPLLVARAWDREMPKDPTQHFMTQVHSDLRTATMNSAEWAATGSTSGRGRFNSGRRYHWKPIDPRVGA